MTPHSTTAWLNWRNIERWQVVPLLMAALAGLGLGLAAPETSDGLALAVWPALGALLFTVFLSLDWQGWRRTLVDRRFLGAVALLNFLLLPLLTGLVLLLLPADPVIQFAVVLVLLAPCTDWFLSFNLLGRGNPERATAAIPFLLAGQVMAIPLWMSLYLGPGELQAFGPERFLAVFIGLFLIPLALALLTRQISSRLRLLSPMVDGLRRAPLALLILVVFLVAATQLAGVLGQDMGRMLPVIPLFIAWLLLALLLAYALGKIMDFAVPARRTLLFNAASRNSFVVLPFALALPRGAELAAGVIMLQALIELMVLILLTWLVPKWIR